MTPADVLRDVGHYTDLCYGYNSFWRHCLDAVDLDPRWQEEGGKRWGDGFEIETIINTRIAKARLKIVEVPSFEKTRPHGDSNLNTWRDGARVLRALVVERVNGSGRARTRPRRLVTATATVPASTGEQWLGGPASATDDAGTTRELLSGAGGRGARRPRRC